MKAMIFLTGLVLMLAGCIIRSPEPVMEKKGIGRLLDDAFKGTAKVADEVTKVDSLVAKAAKTKLTQDDVGVLMGAIVKGGSESIAKFKEIPINKFAELEESIEIVGKRFDEFLERGSPDKLQQIINLTSRGKPQEAAVIIKKNTNIAKDKVFINHLHLLDKKLDEVAEAIADNHRLADSVGEALAQDTPFQMRFAKAEGGGSIAARLRLS